MQLIAYEGLRTWWKDDFETWLQCPEPSNIQKLRRGFAQRFLGASDSIATFTACPSDWSAPTHALTCQYVFPDHCRSHTRLTLLVLLIDKHDDVADDPHEQPLREVGGEYYDRVKRDNVLELQLAQAGIRLAAILNAILADPTELQQQGDLKLAYLLDDAPVAHAKWWWPGLW